MLLLNSLKQQFTINKSLNQYCKKYTEESIRKRVEQYNLEKNRKKYNYLFNEDNDNNKPEFNYTLLILLSIATISFGYYNYKRLC
jgi:hypothetical protein